MEAACVSVGFSFDIAMARFEWDFGFSRSVAEIVCSYPFSIFRLQNSKPPI